MQFKSCEHFHQKSSTGQNDAGSHQLFSYQWLDIVKIHKYTKFELIIQCGSRVMSIFTKKAQPAKMMLGEGSSPFSYQWVDNVKIHKYTNFKTNIPCGSRVLSNFTERAQPAKMMLGEKPRHLFAYQWLDNDKIHKYMYTKLEPRESRVMSMFTN